MYKLPKISPKAVFDRSGWEFAHRKDVNAVLFDVNTGKIWQFLNQIRGAKVDDLKQYPHMKNCEAVSTMEYYKLFNGKYYYEK